MLTFREFIRLKENAGDSLAAPLLAPIQLMIGPNAPIPGNLTGAFPPNSDEQYRKTKKPKRFNREITSPTFDDLNIVKRSIERAKKLGID